MSKVEEAIEILRRGGCVLTLLPRLSKKDREILRRAREEGIEFELRRENGFWVLSCPQRRLRRC